MILIAQDLNRMSRGTDQVYRTLYTEKVTANGFLKKATSSLNSESDCPMAGTIETFFQSCSENSKSWGEAASEEISKVVAFVFLESLSANSLKALYDKINLPKNSKIAQAKLHCVNSVHIRSYSGPHFLAFGLNTDQNNFEYGHFLRSVGNPYHFFYRVSFNKEYWNKAIGGAAKYVKNNCLLYQPASQTSSHFTSKQQDWKIEEKNRFWWSESCGTWCPIPRLT